MKFKKAAYVAIITVFFASGMAFFSACADEKVIPKSQENQGCESFSQDPELCNKSRNSEGAHCYYSVELKKCDVKVPETPISSPDTMVAQQKLREQASKNAEKLLSRRSILNYCKSEDIASSITAQKHLFEAVNWLMIAAKDPANLCAQQLDLLRQVSWLKAPDKKCEETIIEACMDPKNYGQRFLQSLNKLEMASGNDTSYLDSLAQELVNKHKPQLEHGVWGLKNVPRSYLENEQWILDSPRYDDVERKRLSATQHSENFLAAWGDTIASGEKFVDVTSLAVPEGQFMVQLKKSLRTLDAKGKEIIVRIIFGAHFSLIGLNVEAQKVFDELEQQLSSNTKVKLYVGSFSSSELFATYGKKYFSWNHSKIVAVDGKFLLTGGHNLYNVYLNPSNPVHDISLRLPGEIAEIGHRFCDFLWGFATKTSATEASSPFLVSKYGEIVSNQNDKRYFSFSFENRDKLTSKLGKTINTALAPTVPDSEKVIAAGRLANAFLKSSHNYYNVSDTAKLKMIRDAQVAIYISQQAIYPIILENEFNQSVIKELIRAMIRGVDVFILKSSTKIQIAGKVDAYNSGLSRMETFKYFYDVAKNLSDKPEGRVGLLTILFRHFLLLDTANAHNEVPNHSKVLIVDTKASSVGSHNLYDMSHSEFEVILRNPMILLDYFAGFWFSSLWPATPLEQKAHLADYRVGDHVFIQRNSDGIMPRKGWTLGRVVKVQDRELEVRLDFLVNKDSKLQFIRDANQIRRAPDAAR